EVAAISRAVIPPYHFVLANLQELTKMPELRSLNQPRRLVIGIQKGPTSACKTGPPGFRGTQVERESSTLALVSLRASWLPCRRGVKGGQALRGRNLPRDTSADGVPPGTWLRGSNHACGVFLAPRVVTGVHASKNPGGRGAEPPGQYPARWLNSSPTQLC